MTSTTKSWSAVNEPFLSFRQMIAPSVGVIILSGGCQPLPDVRYETDHAEIGTYFDAPLCAGNLAQVDVMIRDLGLALDVPLRSKFRLYWGLEGVEAHCEANGVDVTAAGCHQLGGGRSFVQAGTLEHELVHAIAGRVGAMEPFFEEGIAMALSNTLTGDQSFQVLPSALVGLSRRDFESASLSRSTAKHFVHFLIDERGMAPLNELRKLVHERSTRDQALEAFAMTYAAPMSAFEAAWAARAPSNYDEYPVGSLPVESWKDGQLSIQRTLACDDVLSHGPLEGIGIPDELSEQEGMYTSATFDIVTPGFYEIGLTGEQGAAHLQTGGCWEPSSGRPAVSVIDLEAGTSVDEVEMWACRWIVTLWTEGTSDTELTLTLHRTGDAS